MNQQVKRLIERVGAAFGVLGLGTALTVASLLAPNVPLAGAFPTGGQVQLRSIEMGTSTPSATAQNYLVSFRPSTSATIKGIIVDFCSSSPIIGDSTCTAPTGFDVGGATPTVNMSPGGINGATDIGGSWTAAGLNTISGATKRTLELTNATGVSLSNATTYDFTVTNVTNPSTLGSFYARIVTYTSDTGDIAAYAPGTEGSTDAKDYGGFALSTVTNINITAKVQETLTFCTSGPTVAGGVLDPMDGVNGGSDCTAATTPNLTIGHGSPVKVIDNSQVDAAMAFMQLSTNATNGAVVRMHAGNSCSGSSTNGGLSTNGGTVCNIGGIGFVSGNHTTASALASAVPNAGSAAYGLFVGSGYATTGNSASTTNITPDTNYNDGTHTTETNVATNPALTDLYYGMDDSSGTGVNGTYGDVIANTGGTPANTVNSHLVFAAIASLTTPAGIYQGSESLIATGTF